LDWNDSPAGGLARAWAARNVANAANTMTTAPSDLIVAAETGVPQLAGCRHVECHSDGTSSDVRN